MITIQIRLPDATLANAIDAASKRAMSLDDYINMTLQADHTMSDGASHAVDSDETIEQLARILFREAIDLPEGGPLFLIEDVYKQLDLSPWEDRIVGTRIKLGKAFMRLVKQQADGGTVRNGDVRVRIDPAGKTAQNQQQYRLVRVE